MAFPVLTRQPKEIKRKELFPVDIEYTEGEYAVLSRTGTKIPKEFTLVYDEDNIIPQTDLDLILSYLRTNYGLPFVWVDPELGGTYTVFYNAKDLSYSSVKYKMGWYKLTLTFREK